MLFCVIKNCRNSQGSVKLDPNKKISFHCFPTNPDTLKAWINIVRKTLKEKDWIPSTTAVICSDHFAEDKLYEISTGCRKLRKGTLPTKVLYIPSPTSSDNECEDGISNSFKNSINTNSANEMIFDSDSCDDLKLESNEAVSERITASEGHENPRESDLTNCEDNSNIIIFSKNALQPGLIQVKTEPLSKLQTSGFYITHMYIGEEINDENGCISRKKDANNKSNKNRKRAMTHNLSDDASSVSEANSICDTPYEYVLKKKLKKKNSIYKKNTDIIQALRKQIRRMKASKQKLRDTVRSFKSKKCECFVSNTDGVAKNSDDEDIKDETSDSD